MQKKAKCALCRMKLRPPSVKEVFVYSDSCSKQNSHGHIFGRGVVSMGVRNLWLASATPPPPIGNRL